MDRPLCGPGLARLTLQEAGEALRRGRDLEAGALWAWFANSIQDGNNWFDFLSSFLGCHFVCFSTHVTSDKTGPLVQSLKLCQKANSSPPGGFALNLPGLSMFYGIPPSLTVWGPEPPSTLRRVGVSRLVSTPLCSPMSHFAFV